MTAPLFRPFRLKSLELKIRIVMAPMTRSFSPHGVPGPNVAAYYRRRAEGRVGLILSEGTAIERPAAKNDPKVPDFHGEASLAGWKQVIDGVHHAGGRMGPQLWHVGSVGIDRKNWPPAESPSGLLGSKEAPDKPRGQAMSDADIADTFAAYGRAAGEAKRLGFDVVEIHGAHGYLIDQFFWSATNRRADRFGGATLRERSRFAVEAVKSVRAAVGPDFPVLLRVSQWKQQDYDARLAPSPDAMADWLVPLVEAGADILHCSQRRFWDAEFPEVDGKAGLNFAGWAKKLTGAATITVGSVGTADGFFGASSVMATKAAKAAKPLEAAKVVKPSSLEGLTQRLDRGEFDLVAVGRALLGDPAWAAKVQDGETDTLTGYTPAVLGELF